MGSRPRLPDVVFPELPAPSVETGGLPDRGVLNRSAPDVGRQQTMQLVPAGTPARIVLGRGRVGADLWAVLPLSGRWIMHCIWCYAPGGIDAFESVTWDDEALPGGVTVTHYTGAAGQGIDPTLVAAWAAAGVTYADTLDNLAHSVFDVPAGLISTGGLPNLVAVIRGLKVFDSRTGQTVWTDNAALLTAAYLTATTWGPGLTADWAASEPAFDACDEQVGGKARNTLNRVLDRPAPLEQRIEELRGYARCWVQSGPNGAILVPDRPKISLGALAHDAGDIQRFGKLRKRSQIHKPTKVRVRWTDTSRTPWDASAVADFPPGGSEERVSEIAMPGIHDYSEALRFAAERYNRLTLGDLSIDVDAFDEASAYRVGDVLDLSLPFGISAKPMQLIGHTIAEPGRLSLNFAEYDPQFFSDTVASAPSTPDTSFADPNDPQPPTGLTLAEELFQALGDKTASRLKATWSAPSDFPWARGYRVNVRVAGELVWTDTIEPDELLFRTGTIAEGISYQVDVHTISSSGKLSAPASATKTALGKLLDPGDVPSLSGFESGGEVFLTIGAVFDIDLSGYEVRYGPAGVLWDDAKFVDFINAASGVGGVVRSKIIPEGSWEFLACARDSGGRYSTTPKRLALDVTIDDRAFLVEQHVFSAAPTLTLMSAVQLRRGGPTHWITDAGDGLGYGHADTNNATGNFTDLASEPFSAPRSGGMAIWESAPWDVGITVSGNWAIDADISTHSGTTSVVLMLSPDGSNWTDHVGASHKATGRYAKVRIEGDGVFQLNAAPGLRIDAVPRTESGSVTCSATGPVTVTLDGKGAFVKSINLTLVGQPPGSALYDNVQIAPDGTITFELERFDSNDVRLGSVLLDWEANYV